MLCLKMGCDIHVVMSTGTCDESLNEVMTIFTVTMPFPLLTSTSLQCLALTKIQVNNFVIPKIAIFKDLLLLLDLMEWF